MPKDKSRGVDGKQHQRYFGKIKSVFGERIEQQSDRSVLEGKARAAGIDDYRLMTDSELNDVLQRGGYH